MMSCMVQQAWQPLSDITTVSSWWAANFSRETDWTANRCFVRCLSVRNLQLLIPYVISW